MADRGPIDAKLETLRRCLGRIASKQPFDAEALAGDWDLQDIISVNLERLTQASVDIAAMILAEAEVGAPQTMAESFSGLRALGIIDDALCSRMRGAVGLRNVLVHSYTSIDWRIVYAVVTHQMDDIRSYARAVDTFLAKQA